MTTTPGRSAASDLPIHEVLDRLIAAVRDHPAVVLGAPPGAGKTTGVPLALLDSEIGRSGTILVLEPRRLAARAAAERMAEMRGEPVGETVGYRTRLQSRVGPKTRIEVITEGIFTRRIIADPGLEGVAAVLFDEFHERSLDADLGLALARQTQELLRPDLKLVVMSATLNVASMVRVLDGPPVIEAEGRAFPVETIHLGSNPSERLEVAVARAVRRALGETGGSVLVFLPGQSEIHRAGRALSEAKLSANVEVVSLYGGLERAAQDRALSAPPPGQRRVILASAVAETSLTLPGITAVVDSGLSRVPRFDPASGLTRLATVRVSRASADQRRGRAGRVGPGTCYRLWDEEQSRGLIPEQPAEILEADLTGLALDLARWGARSAEGLALIDPPPAGAFAEARAVLTRLGALDARGDLTPHGRRMAELPMSPRLAHMVAVASDRGDALTGARIAAILGEPGLGGTSTDLRDRLEALERDRSPRARDALKLADRWARLAKATDPLKQRGAAHRAVGEENVDAGLLVVEAFPERVARARGKPGEVRLASGRGAFLEPTDALAGSPWLAVAELSGGVSGDRIRLACPVDIEALGHRMVEEERMVRTPSGRMEVRRLKRIGELVVEEVSLGAPDKAQIADLLKGEIERGGLKGLRWGERASALRARLAFLRGLDDGWPDVSDEGLMAEREAWLWPLLAGVQGLEGIADGALETGLRALIPWDRQRDLDRLAPARLETPLGSTAIDYAAEGGPRVDIRVQELFGVKTHPAVGDGRVPLTLALLSPARRPVQVTKDLPGFWKGSWTAVRAEMRGRYPRHPWPEDPAAAQPTTRVKPRGT
ncbi:MAG: ATP-dependent helicase HrpB [Brevundimonas sp.]|uniref:ATP-dependent helicase HrpB n=1 Tax=Brevundimonas sp. TaxID=1871086 RepID=UPI002AB9E630|nr:ATP-dependent helicase HrpB [Brevundimonas sp.]MDZ4114262.1 ATP-dependent helicase HrpB [Brevundimonas sp.]